MTKTCLSACKNTERCLFLSNEKFLPLPLFVKDITRKYIGINDEFTKFTGLTLEDVKNKTVEDTFKDCFSKEFIEEERKLLESNNGTTILQKARVRRFDGKLREVEITKRKVDDPDRGIILIGCFIDKTDDINDSISTFRAQQVLNTSVMTHGLSHEINNILLPILGYVKYIEMLENLPEEVYKSLEVITRNMKKAVSLIRVIGDYSRDTSSESDISDVVKVLTNIISILKTSFSQKEIYIEASVDNYKSILSYVPTTLLSQVLLNIFINSKQSLLKTKRDYKYIKTFIRSEDNMVVIEIIDNGMGIDADILDKIFDPYFTTKHDEDTEHRGEGFGLFICRNILDSYGGNISVVSIPNRETTVKITLPVWRGNKSGKEISWPISSSIK